MGNLTQLRKLDLAKNKLTTLPNVIGNLTQLEELYLEDNILTILPDSIGSLTQLQHLQLSNNRLIALPDVIGNLIQLKQLTLWKNPGLTTLPDTIGRLVRLQFLELQHFVIDNRGEHAFTTFTILPASLAAIPTLRSQITKRGINGKRFYQGIPIENTGSCIIC